MKTKEISVNVSKKIGQPEYSSTMVSASITMSVEEETEVASTYLEAWAKCWEEVDKQEEEIKTAKQIEESVNVSQEPSEPDPIMTASAPYCPNHKVSMEWKPAGISKRTGKAYAGFYSCPGKNLDGSYCNYRPK